MEQFNYVSVITSLILGVGLTHLLSVFTSIIKSQKVVSARYDGLYLLWLLNFFILYLIYWWAYWDYHQNVVWSFDNFLALLIGPIGLYIATDILTLDEINNGSDTVEHFSNNRRQLFLFLVLLQIWGILVRPYIKDGFSVQSMFNIYKYCQYFNVIIFVIALFKSNRLWHYIIAILFLLEMSIIIFLRYLLD